MKKERRYYDRHRVGEDIFVVFRPDFRMLGSLIDISLGGFGCKYLRSSPNDLLAAEPRADIFEAADGFYASNLSCILVYDVSASPVETSSALGVEARRCGVKFGELLQDQEENIREFLERHALEMRNRGGASARK